MAPALFPEIRDETTPPSSTKDRAVRPRRRARQATTPRTSATMRQTETILLGLTEMSQIGDAHLTQRFSTLSKR